jgi:hypothetical protein
MPESSSSTGFIADLNPVKTIERPVKPDSSIKSVIRKAREIVRLGSEDTWILEVKDRIVSQDEPDTGRPRGSEAVA